MSKKKLTLTDHMLIFFGCLILSVPYFLGVWSIYSKNINN